MSNENIEHGEFDPAVPEYKPMTDAEVMDFAKKMYRNEVFVSWWLHQGDEGLLTSIFMPLIFIDEITRKRWVADKICHFWADMKDAGPRSINGYPMFMSMGSLTQDDAKRIDAKFQEIKQLLGDEPKPPTP